MAGPAVIARDHVFQSLIDLRSDDRLIVRYQLDGEVARVTRFDVPMALVAGDASGARLIGTDMLEGRHLLVFDVDATCR